MGFPPGERLNPRLSETNLTRAVKAVTQVPAASLAEANETLCASLTYGIALEHDRGDGRKSHTVRFLIRQNHAGHAARTKRRTDSATSTNNATLLKLSGSVLTNPRFPTTTPAIRIGRKTAVRQKTPASIRP